MSSGSSQQTMVRDRMWRKARFAIPLVLFAVIALFFAIGLGLNPREVPSPLIGKPVPQFDLPPVKGRPLGLSSRDLRHEVSLVNVFASWCLPCRQEHPLLLALKAEGIVPIHGINYKDRPDDAARWLDSLRDPYSRTGADLDGSVGIDWGVYGVPETFLVDRHGRIVYKHVGAITPDVVGKKLKPLIAKLKAADAPSRP